MRSYSKLVVRNKRKIMYLKLASKSNACRRSPAIQPSPSTSNSPSAARICSVFVSFRFVSQQSTTDGEPKTKRQNKKHARAVVASVAYLHSIFTRRRRTVTSYCRLAHSGWFYTTKKKAFTKRAFLFPTKKYKQTNDN